MMPDAYAFILVPLLWLIAAGMGWILLGLAWVVWRVGKR
jgi:hypothetical protein